MSAISPATSPGRSVAMRASPPSRPRLRTSNSPDSTTTISRAGAPPPRRWSSVLPDVDALGHPGDVAQGVLGDGVEDFEAAHKELESRGVEFEGETLDSGVCHQAFFQDPDGNALAIHHRYAPGRPDEAADKPG